MMIFINIFLLSKFLVCVVNSSLSMGKKRKKEEEETTKKKLASYDVDNMYQI